VVSRSLGAVNRTFAFLLCIFRETFTFHLSVRAQTAKPVHYFIAGLAQLCLHAPEEFFIFSFFPPEVVIGEVAMSLLGLALQLVPFAS
jgi:hypothetical protein